MMKKNIDDFLDLIPDYKEECLELFHHSGPSNFENFDTFQILKLRKIKLTEASLGYDYLFFLIQETEVFALEIDSSVARSLSGGFFDLLESIRGLYLSNGKIITGYGSEIEKLEDLLFKRNIPSYFMDLWFDLKKDLAKFENFYAINSVVYREFQSFYEKKIVDLVDEFKDLEDTIYFHKSTLLNLKARMDSVHHYYNSIKNERLNRTLLFLTIISGVFLPLNLVVGFFGMNTNGLFLDGNPMGTQYVLWGLVLISIFLFLAIPVARILDRYILHFILDRYNFYKNIKKNTGIID